jgi:hypothetical protein
MKPCTFIGMYDLFPLNGRWSQYVRLKVWVPLTGLYRLITREALTLVPPYCAATH